MNTMSHEALARLRNVQGAAHVARLVDAGLTFAQAVQTAQRLHAEHNADQSGVSYQGSPL